MLQLGLFDVVLWESATEKERRASSCSTSSRQSMSSRRPFLLESFLSCGKTVYDVVKDLGKPYDFDKFLPPRPLDEQMKRLNLNLNMAGNQQQSVIVLPSTGPAPTGFVPPWQDQPQGQVQGPPPSLPVRSSRIHRSRPCSTRSQVPKDSRFR